MYLCIYKWYLAPVAAPAQRGRKKSRNSIFISRKTKKMAKKNEAFKADTNIIFRTNKKTKFALQTLAKEKGISLTELILARLNGQQVPDRMYDKSIFESIDKLTRVMNSIGNNINQTTIAIHQIKNSQKMETGDFKQFNSLLQQYLMTSNQLRELLSKTL